MEKMDIAFPNLGIYLSNVPKTITIFGFNIAFYGIIIACGVIAGFALADHLGNKHRLPKDFFWDFSIPAIICCVIGARLYYVIFSWDMYKDDLKSIFNIRQGGLAIYGAAITGFVTLFIFCKIKKQSYLHVVDCAVPGLILGQIMGRWGNFMNRECFGGYTDGLFAMRLPVAMVRSSDISQDILDHMVEGTNYIQVHPTFLYESLLNLCLLIFMLWFFKYKKFDGQIALCYIGGYGIIRFFVEGLRTDQLKIGQTGIAVSQMLGMILFVVSAVTMVTVLIKKRHS